MKYLGIILIVLAVIILGGYIVKGSGTGNNQNPMANNNQNPAQTTVPQSPNTIIYTDNGFSPGTITVKVGTPVTFINQSSEDMWVASNPHPIHTDLSGFDEKQSVSNGGSYTYTFEKAGTWGFHNHKNPTMTGTVIVQ